MRRTGEWADVRARPLRFDPRHRIHPLDTEVLAGVAGDPRGISTAIDWR
jgi:hypothetical protein